MQKTEKVPEEMNRQLLRAEHLIDVAAGRIPADLVIKNASYVDVFSNSIGHGDIAVTEGYFAGIGQYSGTREIDGTGKLVLPGFIDAHIHLESALVSPAAFAKAVLPHGTTAVVTDPHEITNVMGTDGIEYMLQATEGLPIDVWFMIPSCVPATDFDENGATLDYRTIDPFYSHPRVLGLAEMMNFGGVTAADRRVLEKIVAAQLHGKLIDGHAPTLTGNGLNAYIAAGIYSDHECSTPEDALAKLKRGQFIMIREGTAARNLDALLPLLEPRYAQRCMFCCDDRHPSDLMKQGHIDNIVRRAIGAGVDPVLAVRVASYNAAQYFRLQHRGAIAPGYCADFSVIDDFSHFEIQQVYKSGVCMFSHGVVTPFPAPEISPELVASSHGTFHVPALDAADFMVPHACAVLGVVPGEIVTEDCGMADCIDVRRDILKIALVERHKNTGHIGVGFLHGYGLNRGAVATSISHDSHNIIAVGTNEEDIAFAVNRVIKNEGGIVVAEGGQVTAEVILSIAGIMSEAPLENVNQALEKAKEAARRLGVNPSIDPFMTLSFMALPVIPTLRLTTHGVVDVLSQQIKA